MFERMVKLSLENRGAVVFFTLFEQAGTSLNLFAARNVDLDVKFRVLRIPVEASITAKSFFEAHGFTVIASQVVTLRGVDFVNYRMERLA